MCTASNVTFAFIVGVCCIGAAVAIYQKVHGTSTVEPVTLTASEWECTQRANAILLIPIKTVQGMTPPVLSLPCVQWSKTNVYTRSE
jgi:hypothetical protein